MLVSRRLTILSTEEIEDLYSLPRFTEDDRHLYFDLSATKREAVATIHSISAAAQLILQLGYFKAKRQFFAYERKAVQKDLGYILKTYFPNRHTSSVKILSRPTRLEHQRMILHLFNYRLCDREAKIELECKAQRIAMLSTQPIYILRELIQNLTQQRIVVPSYRFLQEMIGRVVVNERTRITMMLSQSMTPEVEKQLKILLQADEGMYRISVLKHEPKDFSYKELRHEVERRKFFQPLHEFAKDFLLDF